MAKFAKAITTGGYVSTSGYKRILKLEDNDLNQYGLKSQTDRDAIVTQFQTQYGTNRDDAIGVS